MINHRDLSHACFFRSHLLGKLPKPIIDRSMASAPVIQTQLNDIKERISLGVLTAIAGRAGCEVSEVKVDRNGVDATIKPISGEPVPLDVQLKSSAILKRTSSELIYDLPIGNYESLRKTVTGTPRILLVLDLHQEQDHWWRFGTDEMSIKKQMFWYDLRGAPAISSKESTRIKIPLDQQFTASTLVALITKIHDNLSKGKGGIA